MLTKLCVVIWLWIAMTPTSCSTNISRKGIVSFYFIQSYFYHSNFYDIAFVFLRGIHLYWIIYGTLRSAVSQWKEQQKFNRNKWKIIFADYTGLGFWWRSTPGSSLRSVKSVQLIKQQDIAANIPYMMTIYTQNLF